MAARADLGKEHPYGCTAFSFLDCRAFAMCQVLRASDVLPAKDEKAVQAVYNIWWLVSDAVASLGGTLTTSPRLTTWKVRRS